MKPDIITQFPKVRTELPAAYRAIYAEHYRRNREGLTPASAMAQKMEAWMHRMVARDRMGATGQTTLEVGAGSLNHLQHEPPSSAYDVVDEVKELCERSPRRGLVRNVYGSVDEIPAVTYDRIISIASFEHYCNLPEVVARCALLLTPDGQMRVAVPSEGTILWKAGWMMTSGIEFRIRYGLSYGVLMSHEHVNTAQEIAAVLAGFFREVQRKVFGLRPSLSFYQFFECRNPILERCLRYSESLPSILD